MSVQNKAEIKILFTCENLDDAANYIIFNVEHIWRKLSCEYRNGEER